jgi:hypothetical protein
MSFAHLPGVGEAAPDSCGRRASLNGPGAAGHEPSVTRKRQTIAVLLGASCLIAVATAARSIGAGVDPRGPLAAYALPEGARPTFDGEVATRLDAGPYVYLEVRRAGGERVWVVTLASSAGAARGVSRVRVVAIGHARSFASKRLARTFDDLYFAVVRPA